jgi:hypothetical protein
MSKISTKKTSKLINSKANPAIDSSCEFPYEPGDNIINNILNYSKVLSIRKSKNMDFFEMVLN